MGEVSHRKIFFFITFGAICKKKTLVQWSSEYPFMWDFAAKNMPRNVRISPFNFKYRNGIYLWYLYLLVLQFLGFLEPEASNEISTSNPPPFQQVRSNSIEELPYKLRYITFLLCFCNFIYKLIPKLVLGIKKQKKTMANNALFCSVKVVFSRLRLNRSL